MVTVRLIRITLNDHYVKGRPNGKLFGEVNIDLAVNFGVGKMVSVVLDEEGIFVVQSVGFVGDKILGFVDDDGTVS